jgi:hypothetical protein
MQIKIKKLRLFKRKRKKHNYQIVSFSGIWIELETIPLSQITHAKKGK